VPWHDDLYLDVIASEHGAVEILDAADLEAAVDDHEASLSEYYLAWREVHRLAPQVRSGTLPEMQFAPAALASMVDLAEGATVSGYRALATSER
jgi:predicted RNA-binding protein associated with RNAse of E/G family